MALKLLPIIQIIIILFTQSTLSVPIYGTKRYGQSYHVTPYHSMVRTTRYPVGYYDNYPSASNYDDYYYQDGFPLYYPRTSKYEVYQAVMPYYYEERPVSAARYGYNYYGYDDPVVDLQEEMIQEAEREQREDAQPIGHEVMYENDYDEDPDEADDTKVAFLQNLILTQMYNDQQREDDGYDTMYDSYDDYRRYDDATDLPYRQQEDKDVDDLKQLAREQNKPKPYRKQKQNNHVPQWYNNKPSQKTVANVYNPEAKRGNKQHDRKNFVDRKPILVVPTTIQPALETSTKREGQKEIVMMRPATPVRNPFSNQVLEMMTKNDNKKRTPSVYDTIKKMLEMEKSLENVSIYM